MKESDGEILAACRRGDEAAWGRLVSRYQRLVYAVARRGGLNPNLSEEVLQEVFKTLIEKLDDIRQPERLQAWLVSTARRKTWRVVRLEILSQINSIDEEAVDAEVRAMPDSAPLPVDVLIQMEEQHVVHTAMQSLDERCRKLLTLLFYQDESPPYSEVAASVGLREGSIGATRARCLQKLLRLLEK